MRLDIILKKLIMNCTLFLACDVLSASAQERIRDEMVKLPQQLKTNWDHDKMFENYFRVFLTCACRMYVGESKTVKVAKRLDDESIEIIIRKEALGYIWAQDDYTQGEKTVNYSANKSTRKPSVVEIDMDKLTGSDSRSGLRFKEIKTLLELVFNENNYCKGKIIHKPYYSNETPNEDILKMKIDCCGMLLPDFNYWCRFVNQFQMYFSSLNAKVLKNIVQHLIENGAFQCAINSALNGFSNVDAGLFSEVFRLFFDILLNLKPNDDKDESEKLTAFNFKLMKLWVKLGSNGLVKSEDQENGLRTKIRLMKSFMHLFVNDKDNLVNQGYDEKSVLLTKAYFAIIYQFTPSEFYALSLDELAYLPDYFEYFLRSTLGFQHISTSRKMIGQISKENVQNIREILEQSESFLIKQFKLDKKVWIHFGHKTIKIIHEKIGKDYLPVFWRTLRNYVALLGGNGILMTFEDTSSRGPTGTNETNTIVRIKRSGFWNLTDPSLEGKVVFTKGHKMAISEVDRLLDENTRIHKIFLEIDGRNNFLCSCWQNRPEIVLFYEDMKGKQEENDLIRSLPGCMVSEAFDIADRSGTEFDLEKIKAVEEKMHKLNPLKISVFFGGNPESTLSLIEKIMGPCSCFKEINAFYYREASLFGHRNKKEAFRRICSALKRLSNENPNFRQLSIEFYHNDLISEFVKLLKEIKLTGLRYFYQGYDGDNFTEKVLSAISKNKFMNENLEYFDTFPLIQLSDLKSGNIFETAPLKRISITQYEEILYYDPAFESLLEILMKKNKLQEFEFDFRKPRLNLFSRNFLHFLSKMKLSRLSIHFISTNSVSEMQYGFRAIFENSSKEPSELSRSLKSFHYFYEVYTSNDIYPLYFFKKIKAKFLQDHLIPHSTTFYKSMLKSFKKTQLLGFWRMNLFTNRKIKYSLIPRLFSVN